MSQLLHQFSKKYCKPNVPDIRPGYLVKVHQKIKEGNKERIQAFEGTVIAVNPGHGIESTFTVRKISEGIGVEKVYPIHSPNVVKVDVLRAHKVRRAKLNFLRALSGKALRLREVELKLEEKTFEQPVEEKAEEVVEEKKEETPVEEKQEKTVEAEPKEKVKEAVVEEAKEEKEAPAEEEKKEE
jgi:large subunit ribosomal protein L19